MKCLEDSSRELRWQERLPQNRRSFLPMTDQGNLVTKSTQEIMEILKELHRSGRTVIIITHDEEIASQAHRVIRILDGRIEEDYCNR